MLIQTLYLRTSCNIVFIIDIYPSLRLHKSIAQLYVKYNYSIIHLYVIINFKIIIKLHVHMLHEKTLIVKYLYVKIQNETLYCNLSLELTC